MRKEGFLIYRSFYKPISRLSDKQLGRLFRAIFKYQLGEVVEVEEDIEMAFEFFKNQFEIDELKYQVTIERNHENGRKGGAPKGNINAKKQPKTTESTQTTQNKLNDKDNDNDNEKDNDLFGSFSSDQEPDTPTDYERFNVWLKENCPHVLKISTQLSDKEFYKLKEKYDSEQIMDVLQRLNNYKEAPKKYVSVYLTALKWLKKDHGE